MDISRFHQPATVAKRIFTLGSRKHDRSESIGAKADTVLFVPFALSAKQH